MWFYDILLLNETQSHEAQKDKKQTWGLAAVSAKQEVLKVLENNRGQYVSGEKMAENLGISRAAIWKAIKGLQDMGYMIDGVRKKGYCLTGQSNRLSLYMIQPLLKDKYKNIHIYLYDQIDSTNRAAKELANIGAPNGTTLIADMQSAGRSRLGRTFVSPPNSGLYMSVILQKGIFSDKAINVTTMTAVAVCRAIEKLTDKKPQIKWVNDILVDGKKVCGILAEASLDVDSQRINRIVIGIGLNISTKESDFPEEIRGVAGSLYETGFSPISRNQFAAAIINEVLEGAEQIETGAYMEEYKKKCVTLGKRVFFERDGIRYEGEAVSIGDNGALIVRQDNGVVIPVSFGEVSVRLVE